MAITPKITLTFIFAAALVICLVFRSQKFFRELHSRLGIESFRQLGISDQVEQSAEYAFQIGSLQKIVGSIRYHALNVTDSDRVAIGSDGYFFYRAEGAKDGHTIDSLRGDVPYSSETLEKMVANLAKWSNEIHSYGGHLLTVIVPNKETILNDLLPRRYRATGKPSRLDQLIERVSHASKQESLDLLDLRPALSEARDQGGLPLYFRTDTHWNNWGRYVGYRAIAEAIHKWYPEIHPVMLDQKDFTIEKMPGIRRSQSGYVMGELLRIHPMRDSMLGSIRPEEVPSYEGYHRHSIMTMLTDGNRENRIPTLGGNIADWQIAHRVDFKTPGAECAGDMLVLQDSFGLPPLGYIAEHFTSGSFIWTHKFDMREIMKRKPSLVLHIIIERYLDVLLQDD